MKRALPAAVSAAQHPFWCKKHAGGEPTLCGTNLDGGSLEGWLLPEWKLAQDDSLSAKPELASVVSGQGLPQSGCLPSQVRSVLSNPSMQYYS